MSNKDLKEYLKDVYALETQLHTYKKVEHQYDKCIQKLKREKSTIFLYEGAERNEKNAFRTNYTMPAPEFKADYLGEKKDKLGHREPVYGFQGTYSMFNRLPERWIDKELLQLEKSEHEKYIWLRIAIMVAALGIGTLFSFLFEMSFLILIFFAVGVGICFGLGDENSKTYLPGNPYYEKYMVWYKKKYEKDILKKEAEYTPKISHVEKEYHTLVLPKLEEINQLLEKVYQKDIINPNYRNYVAVTQVWEYLDSEKCADLESAYQLYEKELSNEVITNNLDLSTYQMERLSNVMPTMMDSLNKVEHLTGKIVEQLYNTEENTTLLAFIAQNDTLNKEIAMRY